MVTQINWEEQWASFAPNFHGGKASIPLPSQEIIELLPGPGFGDFSHPTTRLMISLMAPHVRGKKVFDIGCGSGILSIAAAKMGAKQNFACDIDPEAEEHTRKNAAHNKINISFASPTVDVSNPPLVLMNMISSEQHNAWVQNHILFQLLITSGVLISERKSYFQFAEQNHWQLVSESSLEGWLGFIFKEKKL